MLRLNPSIDEAQADFFQRLRTLTPREREAVCAAIKRGVERDLIGDVCDALFAFDPILAALFDRWQETLGTEAWRAVLRLVFIKDQLLTAVQGGSQ